MTFLINGFNVIKVDRFPHENNIVHIYKYDKLGARINYSVLFTEDGDENPIIDSLLFESANMNATPLVVTEAVVTRCKKFGNEQFFNFFGGVANFGLILIPELPEILNDLGHNKLPDDLTGEADDLHEAYVKECLQFVMESPTRRYGIERSFESLPDAVVLSKQGFMILVDSKAYSKGFSVEADDMRRFKSYVEDFRNRYLAFFGNIYSFVVVSGHFNDSSSSLHNRSDELYKMCNTKMSFLESRILGNITQLIKNSSALRVSVDWKNIFSEVIITVATVQKELTRIKKDNLY